MALLCISDGFTKAFAAIELDKEHYFFFSIASVYVHRGERHEKYYLVKLQQTFALGIFQSLILLSISCKFLLYQNSPYSVCQIAKRRRNLYLDRKTTSKIKISDTIIANPIRSSVSFPWTIISRFNKYIRPISSNHLITFRSIYIERNLINSFHWRYIPYAP